jgi:nucleotide-binding universal stress UspA family protein
MTRIDEGTLLDLALGLNDDPELRRQVKASPDLSRRLKDIRQDVRRHERELHHVQHGHRAETRRLPDHGWRILVAVDECERGMRAAATAAALARASDGEVIVLHVRQIDLLGVPQLETAEEAERLVGEVVAELEFEGVRAHGVWCNRVRGHAASDIVDIARCGDVDLIVTTSRGLGALGWLSGGISRRICQRSDCPVLVVR